MEPPFTALAENVTTLPAQIVFPKSEAMETAGVNAGLTVMVMLLLNTVKGLVQAALLVNSQEITSLPANVGGA